MMPSPPLPASIRDDTVALNRQLEKLARILDADLLYVARLEEDEAALQIVALVGSGATPRSLGYALNQAPCQRLLTRDDGLLCSQPEQDYPRFSHQFANPACYIGVPLRAGTQRLGVCVALYRRAPRRADNLKLIMELAALQLADTLPAVAPDAVAEGIPQQTVPLLFQQSLPVLCFDDAGTLSWLSPSATRLLGVAGIACRRLRERLAASDRERLLSTLAQLRERPAHSLQLPLRWRRPDDGSRLRLQLTLASSQAVPGGVIGWLEVIPPDTEESRRKSLAERAFQRSGQAILVCSRHGRVLSANEAFCRLSHYGGEELNGVAVGRLLSGYHSRAFSRRLLRHVREHGEWRGELWGRHPDGGAFAVGTAITALKYQGKIRCYVAVVQGCGAARQAGQPDCQPEPFDDLTGLPGRNLFHARLQRAVSTAQGLTGCFAVGVLDIDSFKSVNNLLSHQAGDQLLQQIARRLQQRIGKRDTLARTYSDEFAFLLHGITARRQARVLAARLQRAFDQPFQVGDHSLYLTASLGVTVFPDDHHSAEGLLRNLELALNQAKTFGRNQLFIYDASFSDDLRYRHQLRIALTETVRKEQLDVYYQPILHNPSGRVCKLEALVRWHHPELGMISPVEFIPLAEESGLIHALGNQVLRAACGQLKRLQLAGYPELKMSINRSSLEFRLLGLDASEWLTIIDEAGVRPGDIIIEITESLLMDDDPNHFKRIAALRQAGITIAIDDFGTGYSSLNYLRRFPADIVKIDRSFMVNIPANRDDMQLLNGIVEIVHNMGMQVVVEGVEREEQQAYLVTRQCDFTQGYLISQPLPAERLLAFLRQQEDNSR